MDIKQIIQTSINEPAGNVNFDEPMAKHTAFKIGGPADVFIKATSIDTIKRVIELANEHSIQLHVIGNGSNIIVKDEGIRGIVLKTQINNIDIQEKDNCIEVTAQSGALMGTIAYTLLKNEITGFEELSGIPGTIGGAVKMNAGAHGKEMKDVVQNTTYIDMQGNIQKLSNVEQLFSYRSSVFSGNDYIILETTMRLERGNKDEIKQKMEQYANWRKTHQPLEYPNAGSTFKRGDDFITAQLIDECGLKGYTIGGAQVSTKHAGFIINTGNATAKDVLDLVDFVKAQVFKKTGKNIELEIQVL